MIRFYAVAVLSWVLVSVAVSGSVRKTVQATRVDSPPVVDGLLSEDVWRRAKPVGDFTQFDPSEGASPTESTAVYVLYDDNALYVGVRCFDTDPQGIVGQFTRRDRTSEADRFTVMIDSYDDQQTGFVFSTNVTGVQSDGILSQDGNVYDISWDALWKVKTVRTNLGWSAEFEIPFNALRFSVPDSGQCEWGINFRRYISRKKEIDEWVMVPRAERLIIEKWGRLIGINKIVPPLHLEVIPYISQGETYRSSGLTDGPPTESTTRAGVDIKYGASRNFMLDATISPDFGQVEVDESVLNLTVFESYFPEKRPFFTEASQMFSFGTATDNSSLPMFFSRRIGRTPRGADTISAPSGGSIESNPGVTKILGAAKLTGQTSSGFSLATLVATTNREYATVRDAGGKSFNSTTEPRAMYGVTRLKQEISGTSSIGMIGTVAGRDYELPAFSGGTDWSLRFGGEALIWDGYLAEAVASSGSVRDGTAGRTVLTMTSGEHWYFCESFEFASRWFNPNDMGYFAKPRERENGTVFMYREMDPVGPFLRYSLSITPDFCWNWNGARTFGRYEFAALGDFFNQSEAIAYYRYHPPSFEDEQRGIIGVRKRPSSHEFEAYFRTNSSKPVWAAFDATFQADTHGGRLFWSSVSLTVRPSQWVELVPVLYYVRNRKELAWLYYGSAVVDPAIGENAFTVFGDRDLDEVDCGLRGIVTFSRTLSLQWYAQVLLARVHYRAYQRIGATGDLVPYDYAASSVFYSSDMNGATLNANLLLRWEFIPGSTFYLAWTQERYGDSGNYAQTFGKRLGDTFRLPQENVLLAKVAYWFGL